MSTDEIILDIETDGLHNPTTIWCVGVTDETGDYLFTERQDFMDFLAVRGGATVYAHNGIAFDYPVMARLWGVDWDDFTLRDTLVLSRLAEPSRKGGHSLEAWGQRLGFPKGSHSDWTQFSPAMAEYCQQDVEVTTRVLEQLRQELEGFSDESQELEHKVAGVIHRQVEYGWLLDERKCFLLLAELKEKKLELEQTVRETFRPIAKAIREVSPKVKADGSLSKVGLTGDFGERYHCVGGAYTRVAFPEFNLGSRPQIGERLIRAGWTPTKFTETGRPQVDENTLKDVPIPEAQLIADYLTVEKRIGMAQSWLELQREDGRVHGKVNSNGAVTGRMTHYEPNVAQVTAGTKIYGKQMRECWTVPEGCKLVGVDASGLELRMLAHYMNDEAYTQEVVSGDVHTANQLAAGLDTRDQAKTFIYAYLYGAGDAKIGAIAGGGAAKGRKLKADFLRKTPALASLRERVERAARRGYLTGLDGRKIYVRSAHAALNSLLQGAGALVMKHALLILDNLAKTHNMTYNFVGNIHDEIQVEVPEDQAQDFGELAVKAIKLAGPRLKLRCPLDAEFHIGDNWSETH